MRRREDESRNSHLRNMIAILYLNMGQLTWREKEEGGEAYLIGLPHVGPRLSLALAQINVYSLAVSLS